MQHVYMVITTYSVDKFNQLNSQITLDFPECNRSRTCLPITQRSFKNVSGDSRNILFDFHQSSAVQVKNSFFGLYIQLYIKIFQHLTCNELMTPLARLESLPATFVTPWRTPSFISCRSGALLEQFSRPWARYRKTAIAKFVQL